jgi:hypothetical protein
MKIRNIIARTESTCVLDVAPENEELVSEWLAATKLTRIAFNMWTDDLITLEEKEIVKSKFNVLHEQVHLLYENEAISASGDDPNVYPFRLFFWELVEE